MEQAKPKIQNPGQPMNAYRIVFVHGKRSIDSSIAQVVRACAGDVELQSELDIPDDRACDLMLVDYDGLSTKERAALVENFGDLKRKMKLLLVSGGKVKDDF